MTHSSNLDRRGLMLVLSSPSGAGKSSIARNLLDNDPALSLSVSMTTRKRRPSEIDGTHYHFVDEEKFLMNRDAAQLLEWAQVHSNYYGTPIGPVQSAMEQGRDMLFDVDWQGALQMFDAARADIVSIFILPPSMTELRNRLVRRAEDSEDVIEKRLQNSIAEMAHWHEYDYVIINEDLQQAVSDVKAILTAERLRRDRRVGMHDFVDGLVRA